MAGMNEVADKDEADVLCAFELFDADGSGRLDEEEVQAAGTCL